MRRYFSALLVLLLCFTTIALGGCTPENEGYPTMSVRYQDTQGNLQFFQPWVIGYSWPLPPDEDGVAARETINPTWIKYPSEFEAFVIPNSGFNNEISCTFDRKPDSVELYRFGAEFAPDAWLSLDLSTAEPLEPEHGKYAIPDPEPECAYWVKATYDENYVIYLFMITDEDVAKVKKPFLPFEMTGTFLESTESGVRILVTEANFFQGQERELSLAGDVDFSGVQAGDSLRIYYTIDYPGNAYTIVKIEPLEPDAS